MVPELPVTLFSDHNPSRYQGGEELVLRNTLLGLAARGWRCLLAYHEWGDLVPEYEAAGIACRQFDLTPARVNHPLTFLGSVTGQALWARSQGVRLLHCNSYFRAAHAAAIRSLGGFPAICHLHNPPPDYLSRQYRWGLQRLDGFIAVSDQTAAEWSRALHIPRAHWSVLHNGIDLNRFRPDSHARQSARSEIDAAPSTAIIGYCGRLIRDKGIDVLLRAVAKLTGLDVRVVVLGSDAQNVRLYGARLEPELKELAAQLGLADRTIFLGARHDVERWYNAFDILAVPSVYSDPLPLAVVEGLACGVAVVASRIGGIPELLGGPLGELLVPSRDEVALAATLRRLIDDPKRRVELGSLGRSVAEREFGMSRFLDGIEAIMCEQMQ